MSYENDGHAVWTELGKVQDEYYEAIKMLQAIMESGQKPKEPENWEDVQNESDNEHEQRMAQKNDTPLEKELRSVKN